MPFEFLDEISQADLAFRAWGKDLHELFIAAADAVTNVMIENIDAIEPKETREIHLKNEALDLLLFDLLNEFVYYKDSEQLLLRLYRAEIELEQCGRIYFFSGEAKGEKLDSKRHQQRVDVKAVTLHQFKLERVDEKWQATVVLDI